MATRGKENGDRDQDYDDRDDDHDGHHDGDQKKYVSKIPNRRYGFFRDDQIMFLVTHPNGEITQDQLRVFAEAVNDVLRPKGNGRVKGLPEVISFPSLDDKETKQSKTFLSSYKVKPVPKVNTGPVDKSPKGDVNTTERAFSLIICNLKGTPDDPSKLLEIVQDLNGQLSPDPKKPQDPRAPIARLTVYAASPNWLTSVAAESGGTGGPGGKPTPYTGNRKQAPYCFDVQQQLEGAKGGTIYGDGSGVDVAILDTAPSAQALVSAYKEWPDHPLIATLLGPQGKLHLYPATYDELVRLRCTSLNDHDYKMTDHGLFIAGIIHSIVPEAEIHLIEVLNQYGVGDSRSFIQGLQIAYQIYERCHRLGRKLVINCSWFLNYLREDRHCRIMSCTDKLDANFVKAVRLFSKNDLFTEDLLNPFFNRFFDVGSQAIAAAGNDGKQGEDPRVAARYPAALKSVTGIGALPKSLLQTGHNRNNYIPTDFSNLSDGPNSRGVVTRGIVTLGGEEGEGKGILGLYIGEFPGCCRNDSKWAWWSGTSFATPIVTAAVASVLSREENRVNTTQDAIDRLYKVGTKVTEQSGVGAKIFKQGRAAKQENAFPVKQG